MKSTKRKLRYSMKNAPIIFGIIALLLGASITVKNATASVIGYWRMEVDTDADLNKYSITNEVVGKSALTGNIGGVKNQVPVSPIPKTGEINTNSLMGGRLGVGGSIFAREIAQGPRIDRGIQGRSVSKTDGGTVEEITNWSLYPSRRVK